MSGRSRNWCFTFNNPRDYTATIDGLRSIKQIIYAVMQLEKGESGTLHLQGHLNLDKAQKLSYLKKLTPITGAHFEISRDVAASIQYCQKEESRILGPWEWGIQPSIRMKENYKMTVAKAALMSEEELQQLHPHLYKTIKQALSMRPGIAYTPSGLRGTWYYGDPGAGKSRLVATQFPGAYRKSQNKWFDNYHGQRVIVLDDLDKLGGQHLGHYLKIWADRYPCSGEQKHLAPVELQHEQFIVTSNYQPEELWPDDPQLVQAIRRRFKCIHVGQFDKLQGPGFRGGIFDL